MPIVAVIVLNWNNAPDTLECLESVFKSDYPSLRVYVADNGSEDDSAQLIEQTYPEIILIQNGANLGFAEGNNRAIDQALKEGADYFFLLNNDAIIRPETISILVDAAEKHPNASALGPKIYYYNQPSTIWYAGGEWDSCSASFYHVDRNVDETDAPKRDIGKTGYVCGCAFLGRASHVRQIGLMDPRFFLNWEEIDWCHRMQRAGRDCLVVPQAKCWHKISRSFVGGKRGPMWCYFYYRNRLLWMERNLSWKESASIARNVLLPELKSLIRDALRQGSRENSAALAGTRDYILRRFGTCPSHLFKS